MNDPLDVIEMKQGLDSIAEMFVALLDSLIARGLSRAEAMDAAIAWMTVTLQNTKAGDA